MTLSDPMRRPAWPLGPISAWAVPTPKDEIVWQTMTREQQLAALQAHFLSPECTTPTDATLAEIVARTRAEREEKRSVDGHKLETYTGRARVDR